MRGVSRAFQDQIASSFQVCFDVLDTPLGPQRVTCMISFVGDPMGNLIGRGLGPPEAQRSEAGPGSCW